MHDRNLVKIAINRRALEIDKVKWCSVQKASGRMCLTYFHCETCMRRINSLVFVRKIKIRSKSTGDGDALIPTGICVTQSDRLIIVHLPRVFIIFNWSRVPATAIYTSMYRLSITCVYILVGLWIMIWYTNKILQCYDAQRYSSHSRPDTPAQSTTMPAAHTTDRIVHILRTSVHPPFSLNKSSVWLASNIFDRLRF